MKSSEYIQKMNKALTEVEKKQKTLARHQKKKDRLHEEILKRGWDLEEGRYQRSGTDEHEDCYCTFCDYEDVIDAIKRVSKLIEEKKASAKKWEMKVREAREKEAILDDEVPEIFKEFQANLVSEWDKWDIERREKLYKEYMMLGYKKFIEKYGYKEVDLLHASDAKLHKDNVNNAETLILNLWNRVKAITGEATKCSDLHIAYGNEYEGLVINGIVRGTKGVAEVNTIRAGGYNIQKLHLRTLVHEI